MVDIGSVKERSPWFGQGCEWRGRMWPFDLLGTVMRSSVLLRFNFCPFEFWCQKVSRLWWRGWQIWSRFTLEYRHRKRENGVHGGEWYDKGRACALRRGGGRALNLGELHAWLRKCGTCSWWQRQSDNGRRGKKNKPEELCARDANRMETVEEDCVINPVECGRTIKEKENGDATKVSWIWTKKFHTAEWCMMLELRYWALVMDHWRWLCRCQGCPFFIFFYLSGDGTEPVEITLVMTGMTVTIRSSISIQKELFAIVCWSIVWNI